jgi:hypothetical protein
MAFDKMFHFKELGFIKAGLSCHGDRSTDKRHFH